ncbi:MAG: 50S ribosomal protein L35 [Armatimonadota bacterium]|nr:50S ribosomal protein L35 [Armatimonadota bacterium]MDR7439573.1 50S ribosomal protein L35 [Armatimonadota bacterium]MDR7562748.1 50S ribosomal protein L35 [Armatimonadota bacterium]MDR7568657.1 50S ribosomal protein L35 [Armatimonadota bacterium]MDR7601047.1 50S ribosomal protein L35 [Armatimonadota bacterium]
MPKAKTHQGARKRIKVTGTGRLLRRRQGGGHLKEKKRARRLRSLAQEVPVASQDTRRLRALIPYDLG